MVKKSLLWVYRTALSICGIVIAILLISVISIQFFIFPNIDQYKENIATFATNTTKQKVIIGNIKADWKGVNPHLTLSNIDIYDAQNRPALHLKNTDVSLSWLSIPMFEPHLAELIIRSPELTIRRVASGEIFVAGISMQGQSKPDLPNWLLRQTKLDVVNAKIIWLDEMRGANSLSLNKLSLEIVSPPWKSILKHHRITLSAIPSIGTNNPITFSGNIYGNDVSRVDQWHGNITMGFKNANLLAFKPWIDYPVNLETGIGSAEVSINFSNHQVQSFESDVALTNVKMQLPKNSTPVVLNNLAGKFNWTRLSDTKFLDFGKFTNKNVTKTQQINTGQSFSVDHLLLSTDNGLNLQDVSANYSNNINKNQIVNINIPKINLTYINPYLLQLPLPEEVLTQLKDISPTGILDKLTLSWEGNQQQTKNYQINSRFNGLSINAQNKIPGFNNLTGEIKANQNAGKVTLYSQNAKFDFKDILRWPIPIDKLDGEVSWKKNDIETKIQISQLNIINPHLSGTISANYLWDGNKSGYLDLKGKFSHGNSKFAPFYYPLTLSKTTLHWLDTSILAGRVDDINLIVKGHLADFPFVDSKNNIDSKIGLFKVTAKISDGIIEYGTDWPVIDGLGLDLLFEGKRMELNANTGHVYGNQVIKSKATIAQLDADSPMLNIESELKGPVSEAIKFVNNSPVVKVTQGFTEDIKTSGSGKLNLSLKLPLQDIESAKYRGLYQIINGSMENINIPTLNQVNGMLEFSESSLTAKNINAFVLGAPLTFNLNSGKDKTIRVTAKGKLNDESIKQAFLNQNLIKGANYISGSTDWVGDILIQKPNVTVGIRADLFGITSNFPAPLNKNAIEHLNLRIDKKQDANTDIITLNISNRLGARIFSSFENGKLHLDRVNVHFNSTSVNNGSENTSDLNYNNEPIKPKGLQVQVSGNLDYLDADAWRNVVHDLSDTSKQGTTFPIQKIDLKINILDIFDRRLNQLNFSNKADKDGLRATIQSREITGDVQWTNQNNGKLIARLSNLTIPDAVPNQTRNFEKVTGLKEFRKLDQDYPALDIIADNFEINKKNLGGLELIAYPQNENWNIQKLKFINPESTISAEGQWNNWVRNPNTFLNITWDIKDLGKTLKRIGYPDTIKGGEGQLSGQLHWPGSPHEFDTIGLNGNLQFEVRKGQILKVQPGVGRLLGLLSLQSLPRRLSLDFRDLFSNGFAFDKINATVKIERGVMRSDNFTMSGPAAEVTIKGETNLQKETQQLFVKVMPHVSDSLSLAALAGGPLAGAVAFLAQKILKDPLNKIASSEYEIIGTWDNPQEVKTAKNTEDVNNNSPLNQ